MSASIHDETEQNHLPDYDMIDPDEEIERSWPLLAELLRFCRETILPPFREADRTAVRCQWHHKIVVMIAAVCGSLAVMLAIAQLALQRIEHVTEMAGTIELISALLALVAVGFGLWAARQKQWLLERHKAERFRLLKYAFLVNSIFCKDHAALQQRTSETVEVISDLDEVDMEGWLETRVLPEIEDDGAPSDPLTEFQRQLQKYILTKRVSFQKRYFQLRANTARHTDHFLHQLPPAMFFASVICVFLHAGWDRLQPESARTNPGVGIVLTFFAAALPVLGAGIRTIRSAMEYGRNTLRYVAAWHNLKKMEIEIEQAHTTVGLQLRSTRVEQLLEVENREWLRLMIEAEWFG